MLSNYIEYFLEESVMDVFDPKINKRMLAWTQERRLLAYSKDWSDELAIQTNLSLGAYLNMINALGKDLDELEDGLFGEKLYFTKLKKSCLVVAGLVAVAFQKGEKGWTMYSPTKKLNYPWIKKIIKDNGLSEDLSPMMPWMINFDKSDNGMGGILNISVLGGDSHSVSNGSFLEYEILRQTPEHLSVKVWEGVGESASLRLVSITKSRNNTKNNNLETIETVIHFEEDRNALLLLQTETSHKILLSANPYRDDNKEQYLYYGDYLRVTKEYDVWVECAGAWVPAHRSALLVVVSEAPHTPLAQEILVYNALCC